MSTKSKACTAASSMGRSTQSEQANRGDGHGAAQLTFDDYNDEEAKDDREEEGGLHMSGARTHLACCGSCTSIQSSCSCRGSRRCWQSVARRLEARAAMPSNSAAAVLATSAAAVLIEEKAGMPLEAVRETVMRRPKRRWRILTASGLKCRWPASGHRSRPRRQ